MVAGRKTQTLVVVPELPTKGMRVVQARLMQLLGKALVVVVVEHPQLVAQVLLAQVAEAATEETVLRLPSLVLRSRAAVVVAVAAMHGHRAVLLGLAVRAVVATGHKVVLVPMRLRILAVAVAVVVFLLLRLFRMVVTVVRVSSS